MNTQSPGPDVCIHSIGVDGMLVSFGATLSEPANRAALAFRAALDLAKIEGVVESSTSLVSTFLRFDLAQTSHDALRAQLETLLDGTNWYAAALPSGRRIWTIPATFGGSHGPQLRDVAKSVGLDEDQAIAAITSQRVRVQTVGFAPGMPYLGALPRAWDIPRSTKLNPKVPAGGICAAIRQLVVFPVETQTGWHHIGQTGLRVFQPDAAAPFALAPGDEVQFQAVGAEDLAKLARQPLGGATSSPAP